MKQEHTLILQACLVDKSDEEIDQISNLLSSKLDWCEIAGQLLNHRLGGYFYFGLTQEQRKHVPKEVIKALELLIYAQKVQTQSRMKTIMEINQVLTESNIHFAMLKGTVFIADVYTELGSRRSNDIDIMVKEDDLPELDKILRNRGYIQTNQSEGEELKEASKKEKLIQRMNYHDLVPYVKQEESDISEIDINFLFDSKDNLIDDQVFGYEMREYAYGDYSVTGLPIYLHLAHLCIHFHREGTNTLWTNEKRDVVIYKVVDIINSLRKHIKEINIDDWCNLMKDLNLQKQCYYTFFVLSQFYNNGNIEKITEHLKPSDSEYVNNIKVEGTKETKQRERTFLEDAFDCKR